MSLFGTSGIRGVVDSWLVQLALKVGLAVGNGYRRVVVGRDTRTSGDVMQRALTAGLLAAGSRCHDAGILPIPTLALAAREFDAGVMITASHNPPQYNGIKLINPDGSAFDGHQQQQIEAAVLSDSFPVVSWDKIAEGSLYEGAVEQHVERILADFPGGVKLRVVVDSGGGAASLITPRLLTRLGCDVITINCQPTGFFPRDIEPTEANLGELIRAVGELGASLGIAHDGDADRMMVVDDRGRFVPGDKLMAILARAVGARVIVTTVDASMAIDEMGFTVSRTRVGDSYVSVALKEGGDFGGEPSGSWIFPAVSLCPDGIYAAARITAIASRQKLSQLVDAMPAYPLRRGSINHQKVVISSLEPRLAALKPLSMSRVDGIRLDFEDGWLLVRASGTEPKVRLTAEARSEVRARQLYDSGVKVVRDGMKAGRRGID